MKRIPFFLLGALLFITGFSHAQTQEPPTESYYQENDIVVDSIPLDSFYYEDFEADSVSIIIEGDGFSPIVDKSDYLQRSEFTTTNTKADTLLFIYNSFTTINALAYDCSTIDRYFDEINRQEFAEAFLNINLDFTTDQEFKSLLQQVTKNIAKDLTEGKNPSEQNYPKINKIFEHLNSVIIECLGEPENSPFDATALIPNYKAIHQKAISDRLSYREELKNLMQKESDFQKQCIYAREFAYANHNSPMRDDEELCELISPLLSQGEYSPLLYDLWVIWRAAAQGCYFGLSNDSEMHNLMYNKLRNSATRPIITHLISHPDDKLAIQTFAFITLHDNIVRNSGSIFGNNAILDQMYLYQECLQ